MMTGPRGPVHGPVLHRMPAATRPGWVRRAPTAAYRRANPVRCLDDENQKGCRETRCLGGGVGGTIVGPGFFTRENDQEVAMAFSESLAGRIRDALARRTGVE